MGCWLLSLLGLSYWLVLSSLLLCWLVVVYWLAGVVPAWWVFAAGCGAGCWVYWLAGRWVKGRKERQYKINIPTQNIIYTTFKGWLYNIAKSPYRMKKGNSRLLVSSPLSFIPYAFKISTSTPILINKSSTSLSLLRGFANSTFIFSLLIYVSKSPRNK